MELRVGYKNTEVGSIPDDWEVKSIQELTPQNKKNCIVDGPFGSNLKTIHYRKSGIPIITSGYVTNGYFFANEYLYVDLEKFKQEKRSAVNAGDIVMAKIGERCGACAILPKDHQEGILSGNALKITIDETKYLSSLIWQILYNYYLTGKLEILRTTGAQPALSMANLKKFAIPIPPTKAEQTAIANALSDADALINSLEKIIAKKRNIKQGSMQKLLQPKEGWEVKKLGEVAEIYQPQTISQDVFIDDGYLVYGANGVVGKYHLFNHETWQTTITCRGSTCGTVNRTVGKSWITGNAMVMNVDKNRNIDKLFFYYILTKQDFSQCITGSGQPQIVRTPLFEFKISIPRNIDKQAEIAAILSDMDAQITTLETKLEKYKKVKLGMMQNLLTGKIRLI